MANKQGPSRASDKPTTPKDFAATTPQQVGTDLSGWLLNAVTKNTETLGKVDATIGSLHAQMDRIETKLDAIETEVKGHGNWVHTLKYVISGVGVLIAFAIAHLAVPWVTAAFFPGQ
ncbi:MAG: hypothetical protein ABI229_05440 [Gemmatimonadaceae bacterium]